MLTNECPNFTTCQLINGVIEIAVEQKKVYIGLFCRNDQHQWNTCKRLVTKQVLGFCPDFVLPDTTLTTDEILEKFDEN